jgi:hypothetical protein
VIAGNDDEGDTELPVEIGTALEMIEEPLRTSVRDVGAAVPVG